MAEDKYSTAKTSQWWDIENYQVPNNADLGTIAQNITSALANMDYKGPVPSPLMGTPRVSLLPFRTPSSVTGSLSIMLLLLPNAAASLTAAAKNIWLWTSLLEGKSAMQSTDSAQLGNTGLNAGPSKGYGPIVLQEKPFTESVSESFNSDSTQSPLVNQKVHGSTGSLDGSKRKHIKGTPNQLRMSSCHYTEERMSQRSSIVRCTANFECNHQLQMVDNTSSFSLATNIHYFNRREWRCWT